jgi:transcriptional regulator with XRE-family HTH domain
MRQLNEKREWLKDLRKEKKLTVREIAPMLGTSFSHYSDIENGRRNPSVDLSMAMADFFDIDLTQILKDRVRFSEKNIG